MSKRSLEILDKEEQSLRIKIQSLKDREKAIALNRDRLEDALEDLIDSQRLIKLYSPGVMLSGRDIKQLKSRGEQ